MLADAGAAVLVDPGAPGRTAARPRGPARRAAGRAERASGDGRDARRRSPSPGDPRLRHLHLRLDRPAQGRRGPAPRRRPPGARAPTTSSSARTTGWRRPRTARSTPPPSRSGARCSTARRLVGIARGGASSRPAPWPRRSRRERRHACCSCTTALFNQIAPRGAGRASRRCAPLLFGGERGRPRDGPRGAARTARPSVCSTSTARPRRRRSPPGTGCDAVPPGATVPIGRPIANGTALRARPPGCSRLPVGRAGRALPRRRRPGARLPRTGRS